MFNKKSVVLAVSSTGGHLYPALRVAEELGQNSGCAIFFIGPDRTLPRQIVAEAGFNYLALPTTGWGGGLSWRSFTQGLKLALSFPRAWRLLRQVNCRAVFSLGSYSALPVAWAAWRQKRPLIVYEPNARPGKINLLTSRWAKQVAVAWPETAGYFPDQKVAVTGLPLRQDFFTTQVDDARSYWSLEPDQRVILVFGGSQGAEIINQTVVAAASRILARPGWQIIHISGPAEYTKIGQKLKAAGLDWRPLGPGVGRLAGYLLAPYSKEMPKLILAADLVVGRAGALTVGEIATAGKPAIFIPFGRAAEQHQVTNAEILARTGQAKIIPEENLTAETLLAAWQEMTGGSVNNRAAPGQIKPDFSASARTLAGLIKDVIGHE